MGTNYPGAIDTFTAQTDDVDDVLAADMNDVQDPVNAIETELGTDPAGAFATVKARLDDMGGGQQRKSLPISAAHLPDDTANNAAAQIQIKTSSTGSNPKPRWVEALFDDATDEHIMFSFLMPDNYASAPVVDVYYKATSATSGTAAFGSALMAVTDGDAVDVDADSFATANNATATVPGTAGHLDVISITMTNDDGVAANDWVTLIIFRDVSADGVVGDLEVPLCVLRYTGN